ncbi:PAS domain S-box protein [Owenweeksia hongkongensis]|uniref:PAS domain S-box protein n=1 Tax=Owenweeksia hongkongensis TaxID=253245 RepID=UPI003A9253E7
MKRKTPNSEHDLQHAHGRDMIYKLDGNGRFTFVNNAMAKFFDVSVETLLGLYFTDVIREDYRKKVYHFYIDQFERKLPSTYFEFPVISPSGKDRWVGQSVEAVTNEDQIVEFLAVSSDITDRVLASLSLRYTEERYRHVIENINLGTLEVTQDDTIISANRSFCNLSEYEVDELITKKAVDLLKERKDSVLVKRMADLANGSAIEIELESKSGNSVWVMLSVVPIKNKHNEEIGHLCVFHNVSKMKLQERSLQELLEEVESRNEDLKNKQDFLTSINDFAAKLIGSSSLGQVLDEMTMTVVQKFGFIDCRIYLFGDDGKLRQVAFFPNEILAYEADSESLQKVVSEGVAVVNSSQDGSVINVPLIADGETLGAIRSKTVNKQWEDLQTLTTLSNLSGNRIKSAIVKLKRLEAERALKESETRLRSILDSALDAMITIDENGIVTEWNLRAEEIFGYSIDETLGKDLSNLIVPEKYREAHNAGMKHFLNTGNGPILNQRIEIHAEHKNGDYFPVELSIVPIQLNEGYLFSAFIRDITLKKKAEDDMSTALQKQKELAELKSRLISMTSHEYRTPLTTIKSSLDLLSFILENQNLLNRDKIEKNINRINFEIDRLNTLVNDILTVGKLEAGSLPFRSEPTDVVELCSSLIENTFGHQKDGRVVNLEVLGNPVTLQLDESLYSHILSNLLQNAFKYSPLGKNPQLHLRFGEEHLEIRVKDSGIGIPLEEQELLFDSFYRGSNVKNIQGHGMGLAIVKQFVELHGGSIEVISEEGEGTEFILKQPYKQNSQ